MVILRCMKGHQSGYKMPLTIQQQEVAEELYKVLTLNEPDMSRLSDAPAKLTLQHLHLLLWLLWKEPDSNVSGTQWSLPVTCYIALRALREDGNFISPESLTPLLAKLKYASFTITIVEADATKTWNSQGMIR
jgi:hypothetical protein